MVASNHKVAVTEMHGLQGLKLFISWLFTVKVCWQCSRKSIFLFLDQLRKPKKDIWKTVLQPQRMKSTELCFGVKSYSDRSIFKNLQKTLPGVDNSCWGFPFCPSLLWWGPEVHSSVFQHNSKRLWKPKIVNYTHSSSLQVIFFFFQVIF